MVGKKSKNQANEFYYFMVERKPEVEKRLGKSVPMNELAQHLYVEWKNLPECQKKKYKDLKEQNRDVKGKLDCRGVSLSELQKKVELDRRRDEEMQRDISTTVDLYRSGGALQQATFYVLGASYYVHTDEGQYTPAEVGLVQFSIQRGIIKEHNVILNKNIPQSYLYLAQEHSEATHNLLDENNCDGQSLEEAFQGLCEFVVEERNQLPPLYTLQKEMAQARGVLSYLGGEDYFKVYSLDLLFKHIYASAFPGKSIPLSISHELLTHCGLDYHPDMACQWHVTHQPDYGKYCAVSCARRWVFLMCDNLKLMDTFGVLPQEGRHLPRAGPVRGVLVDVPRTSSKYDYEETTTSMPSTRKHAQAANKEDDVPASFSFTSPRKQPVAVEGAEIIPPDFHWDGVKVAGDWKSTPLQPGPSPSRASSAASLFVPASLNTSSEDDFPSLGAGMAKKGHGGTLAALGGVGRGMTLDQLYMGAAGIGRGQRAMNRKQNK